MRLRYINFKGWLISLLYMKVHPLSYLFGLFNIMIGVLFMYTGATSLDEPSQSPLETGTVSLAWGALLTLTMICALVGFINSHRVLVIISADVGGLLWTFAGFAWITLGQGELLVIAIPMFLVMLYFTLAATVNKLDRI